MVVSIDLEQSFQNVLSEFKKLYVPHEQVLSLKLHYKNDIDSSRTFESIHTFIDLVDILCKRCVITFKNIDDLYEILRKLNVKNNVLGGVLNRYSQLLARNYCLTQKNDNEFSMKRFLPENVMFWLCQNFASSWKTFARKLPVTIPEYFIDFVDELNINEEIKLKIILELFMARSSSLSDLLNTVEVMKKT